MISVLNDGADEGGEPRVDQAEFSRSCDHKAHQRLAIVAVLAAFAVGLGAFEVVYRSTDPARRKGQDVGVAPFKD
jgi:hypothetical protein